MTCGDINIWPHPTIKSAFNSKSLKFTSSDIELKIITPFLAVENLFKQAFSLFLQELRQIENLNIINNKNNEINQSYVKIDDKVHNFLMKKRKYCDIDIFLIEVIIKKSDDINLNLNTDESYNITSQCK